MKSALFSHLLKGSFEGPIKSSCVFFCLVKDFLGKYLVTNSLKKNGFQVNEIPILFLLVRSVAKFLPASVKQKQVPPLLNLLAVEFTMVLPFTARSINKSVHYLLCSLCCT